MLFASLRSIVITSIESIITTSSHYRYITNCCSFAMYWYALFMNVDNKHKVIQIFVLSNYKYSSAKYVSYITEYSTFSHNVNKNYLGSIGDFRSSTLGLEKTRASIRRPLGPISLLLVKCLPLALVSQGLEPRSPNIPHRREQCGQLERVFSIKNWQARRFHTILQSGAPIEKNRA